MKVCVKCFFEEINSDWNDKVEILLSADVLIPKENELLRSRSDEDEKIYFYYKNNDLKNIKNFSEEFISTSNELSQGSKKTEPIKSR